MNTIDYYIYCQPDPEFKCTLFSFNDFSDFYINSYTNNYNNNNYTNYHFDLFYFINNFKKYDYLIYHIFLYFSILSTSIFFSSLFVSRFVYKPLVDNFVKLYTDNPDLYSYDPFLLEYIDEYDLLEHINITDTELKQLINKYIKISTKFGNVLMNYDDSSETFNYYTKKSNLIPFIYLDVVSRIYVVKYNCKSIYIENQEFIIDHSKNESQNNSKKNSVFYSQKKIPTDNLKKYKSNKYKYRGTIEKFYKQCKFYNYNIKNINNLSYIDSSNNDLSFNLDLSSNIFLNSDFNFDVSYQYNNNNFFFSNLIIDNSFSSINFTDKNFDNSLNFQFLLFHNNLDISSQCVLYDDYQENELEKSYYNISYSDFLKKK